MTDRELLERAAKAVGREYQNLLSHGKWNPLADDGDALRLAVKLGMSIMAPARDDDRATLVIAIGSSGAREPHGDPYAATRRAIVRAAAELAK